MLLDAAETLAPLDAALARETYLDALDAALVRRSAAARVTRSAEAARARSPARRATAAGGPAARRVGDDVHAGYAAGVPALRVAVAGVRRRDGRQRGRDSDNRWLWLASRIAVGIFDDELAHLLASRNVRLARESRRAGHAARRPELPGRPC